VYPSRQVADRYKLRVIKLKNGTLLRGIVSGENEDNVTVGAADWEHRVARTQVVSMQPQPVSLMPDRLLNRLTWDEIRDLMTFLDSLGSPVK
jgi:putative heme-binding domain-containing protein